MASEAEQQRQDAHRALADREQQLAAAQREAEEQRAEAVALAATLTALQQGTLIEKEQQVSAWKSWSCADIRCLRTLFPWVLWLSLLPGHSQLWPLTLGVLPCLALALQLLLGRAEVKELRQQLADQEQAAAKLRVRLAG